MRITAVIPSYNRHATLARALHSVLGQSHPVDQVIVVDDGSDDASAAMVARDFPAVELMRQPNRGVSAARNAGIAAARGDWIALLDSDDAWLPHKIARVRDAVARYPGYALYHSDETWIRRGRRVNPKRKHRKHGGWIFRHCLPLCAISPSAAVIRRDRLVELGGFDESLPACEDYDLWLRLCSRYPVHYIDEPLVTRYGGHADQLSARYPAMDRFRVRALARLLDETTLAADDARAARETLQRKLDILIAGAIKHGNRDIIAEFEPIRARFDGAAAS